MSGNGEFSLRLTNGHYFWQNVDVPYDFNLSIHFGFPRHFHFTSKIKIFVAPMIVIPQGPFPECAFSKVFLSLPSILSFSSAVSTLHPTL